MTKATANDDNTKAACLYMLKRGLASVAEITALSGRSRQIVRLWSQDHPDARDNRLRQIWERALDRAKSA